MSDVVRLRWDERDLAGVADAALRSLGSSHAPWVADVRRCTSCGAI